MVIHCLINQQIWSISMKELIRPIDLQAKSIPLDVSGKYETGLPV